MTARGRSGVDEPRARATAPAAEIRGGGEPSFERQRHGSTTGIATRRSGGADASPRRLGGTRVAPNDGTRPIRLTTPTTSHQSGLEDDER